MTAKTAKSGAGASAPAPDDLITPDAACAKIGICRSTLYAMLRRGELAYFQIGPRMRRIRRADLEAYLATRRIGAGGIRR